MAGSRGSRTARTADRGAVTVELALALPVLVVVAWAALWAVGLAGLQMSCIDAARAGARAAARGESLEQVTELVRSIGPPGARVRTSSTGELVTVRVVASSRTRLLGRLGPQAVGSAVARREPIPPEARR